MPKRTYLRAGQFQPHPADAAAVEQLSSIRFSGFGLTPRGRVYGASGRFADSNVKTLLELPHLIEVTVNHSDPDSIFTDKGLQRLLLHPSLKIFGCAENPALTDRSAAALSSAIQMKWFCLNGSAITDTGVEHISKHHQLLGLYLADTKITQECVPYLCRLTNLRYLRLSGTLVTESFRDTLSAHLPRCRELKLGTEVN